MNLIMAYTRNVQDVICGLPHLGIYIVYSLCVYTQQQAEEQRALVAHQFLTLVRQDGQDLGRNSE